MSTQQQLAPLRHVLFSSFARMRDRKRTVTLALLTFTLLTTTVSTFLGNVATKREEGLARSVLMTTVELQDAVAAAIEFRTEEQLMLFLDGLHIAMKGGTPLQTNEAIAAAYIVAVGPIALTLTLLQLFLLTIAVTFFLRLLSSPSRAPLGQQLLFLPLDYLKLILVQLWSVLRSFAWIPVIGPFLGLWFAPRLLHAPAILIAGGRGVMESVRLSIDQSRGSWFSHLGRLLFLILSILVLLWIVIVIAAACSFFSLKLGTFLFLMGLFAIAACASSLLLEI